MSIINITNSRKLYGEFEAVKGISFHIEQGEVFLNLSPNGAGQKFQQSI